jgi:hypothetical protein
MCDYYLHIHACTHTSSALGRYCQSAALIQTPCKNKHVWQSIRLPDGCDDCGGDPEVYEHGPEKPKKGRIGISKKRVVKRR